MRLQQEASKTCTVDRYSLCTLTFSAYFLSLPDSLSCSVHTHLVWYRTSALTLSTLLRLRSALLFITPHLSLSLTPNRALYDRVGEADGDLSFKKDDILYVDESLPKGSFGTWMAWQLDENAQQIQRGQIPSKYMWVENSMHAYTHIHFWASGQFVTAVMTICTFNHWHSTESEYLALVCATVGVLHNNPYRWKYCLKFSDTLLHHLSSWQMLVYHFAFKCSHTFYNL